MIGPNARALLDTIRLPEGTSGAQGYNTMFTGKTFSDLSRHPRQINRSNGLASDAAGAYQFLSPTWDSAARDLGLNDFSPFNQDLAALHLIRRRGVDPDKPLTREALAKLAPEWASLPTMQGKSYYGQPVMSADKLLSYYQSRLKGNGVMAAPSTPPVAAAPNPVSPRASSPLEAVAAGILGSAGEAGGFRAPAPSAMSPKAAAAEASGLEGVVGAILDNSFTGSPGKRKRFAASSELLPGLFNAATGLPIEDLESLMSGAGRSPRFRSTPGFDPPMAPPGQPAASTSIPEFNVPPTAFGATQARGTAPALGSGEKVDMVALGKMLQDQGGLRVREHSQFGGVGGHSPGSLHYKDQAFDLTDWKDPGESQSSWLPRKKYLEQRFSQILGPTGQIYGPSSDPGGHGTHIHLGVPGGQLPLSTAQQLVQARLESLEKYPLRWAG